MTLIVRDAGVTRPRLLLHLGWDATTGSVLQQHFDDRSARLLDVGVLYPSIGRSASFPRRHDLFAEAFRGEPARATSSLTRAELLAALRAEVSEVGADSVLLSSAEFASFREHEVQEFAAYFGDFAIHPVVVLRNFTDWLSQQYGERLLVEPVTSLPNAASFAGRMFGRLAAWGTAAHDGTIGVIDADGPTAGRVGGQLTAAFGLDEALSDLPPEPDTARDPFSPALVAIVREFRASGVPEAKLQELTAQLAKISFTEYLTNVAEEDATMLDQRYATFHERLRGAPFARWRPSPIPPTASPGRVHINGAAAAVFAIGRALRS